MRHHLDRDIATYTRQEVLVTPDRKAERLRARFDNTRCSLKVMTGYNPRVFVADVDEFGGDSAQPVPLSIAVGEAE